MRIEDIDSNFKLPTLDEPDIEWISARDPRFSLYGVFFDEQEGRYIRLPSEVAKSVSDGVANLYRHTSGGRLRFRTDSPYVAVKAVVPSHSIMRHMPPLGTTGFTFYSNGVFHSSVMPDQNRMTTTTDPRSGIQGIVKFSSTESRELELYFPLYNGVFELFIGVKQGSGIEPCPYADSRRVVFYGSSITQGGCASRPGNDYAAMACRRLGVDYVNMGFSGNAKGEPLMAEYLADMHADVYVIDYDHNAPSSEHLEATHYPLYRAVREKNPDAPMIFMSRPNFTGTCDNIRRRSIIRATYERARAEGDELVYFIDGETLFEGDERDACTVDGCHPNDLGFYRMARAVVPVLRDVLTK